MSGDTITARTDRVALLSIYGISALVFLVVAVLNQLPEAETVPAFATKLPAFNAMINTCCTIMLLASWFCIRTGRVSAHRYLNMTTFLLSAVFLISYVTYHSFGLETKYPVDNPLRPYYLFILFSHIVLAAVVLPLVLFSFYFALTDRLEKHRKVARIALPVWLYVTTTGVVVYLMISPYYQF